MILRSLMKHVNDQNWIAVFIDFMIVVVGVFIGIQVSNWNTARQEHNLEREYLGRLAEDLSRSVENADQNIVAMERQYRLLGIVLDKLDTCTLDEESREDFALGIYLMGRLEPPPLVQDTIDELRSTGRMNSITNSTLRSELLDVLRQQKGNSDVFQLIVARATPQIAYIDARTVLVQPEGGFQGVTENGIDPDRVRFDFPALCEDPQYAAAASTLREVTRVVTSHNRVRKADYQRLIGLIEHEIEGG